MMRRITDTLTLVAMLAVVLPVLAIASLFGMPREADL